MENLDLKWDGLIENLIYYGTKLLGAIVVFLIGWWIINRIVRGLDRLFEKKDVEVTLRPSLLAISKVGLRILLFISVAGMVGIKMTSFIAILGAAGLAVGMALQGSLANFAGGILLLVLKPIKEGDFIEAVGHSGTVNEIHLFHTYLTTMNKQEIIIPNGKLANDSIINYSRHNIRGMGVKFKVGYENDIDRAKAVLEDIVQSSEGLVKDPKPSILVTELSEYYMTLTLQAWFESDKFWGVYNALPERVKKRFDQEGIAVPYPKITDVHIIKEK